MRRLFDWQMKRTISVHPSPHNPTSTAKSLLQFANARVQMHFILVTVSCPRMPTLHSVSRKQASTLSDRPLSPSEPLVTRWFLIYCTKIHMICNNNNASRVQPSNLSGQTHRAFHWFPVTTEMIRVLIDWSKRPWKLVCNAKRIIYFNSVPSNLRVVP